MTPAMVDATSRPAKAMSSPVRRRLLPRWSRPTAGRCRGGWRSALLGPKHWRVGRVEVRGLLQDGQLEALKGGTGIDTELVGQRSPAVTVDRECVSLAARAVQSPHQLAPQSFPQRVVVYETLQLGDQLRMAAPGQIGLEPPFDGDQAELIEAGCLTGEQI